MLNKIPRLGGSTLLAVALAVMAFGGNATAQDWPTRPLTMIVPFAAGGPSDVTGRILAQRMGELLGQQVIVENVGGAGGTIGSNRVARAAPDGYQFVLGNSGTHVWSQSLYKRPPFNTVTDFAPVGLVTAGARLLLVPKDFPAKSLPEFIAYVKANQTKVKFGSAGAGSASHIGCVLLNSVIGVDITHIPYRGAGPAMQDLLAGRIDYMCDAISTGLPQIQGGAIRGIANLAGSRAAVLPDLATAQEQGLTGFDLTAWQGLFLPKGTPEAIVKRLAKVVSDTLDTPYVRQRVESLGDEVIAPERRGPDYLAKTVASEIEKWSGPIKASGVSVE